MRILLDQLAASDARGTFFTLGWIAERHPGVVRAIAAAGHEVGSHGWGHERIPTLTPEEFRASVRDSKAALEDLIGQPVLGYRAPSFSILRGGEWALDILIEEGYRYDSSLFPVRRAGYGYEGGERDPHRLVRSVGVLDEVPPATIRLGSNLLPAGGGAYFRLLPYRVVHAALKAAEHRRVPGTFYIHPWELDPEQPRFAVTHKTRIRHYGGLRKTARRIRRLLTDFRFQPIAETLYGAGV
jgi:polysaccharide deacetylase family protein (PEP-CTERM system associated)